MTAVEDSPEKGTESEESAARSGEGSGQNFGQDFGQTLGPKEIAAGLLAWVIPGAGHFLLGKQARAVVFCGIVLSCAAIGFHLEGRLDIFVPDDPLSKIATLASAGSGAIYFALRYLVGYEGNIVAPGFEYGTTFLRTAGILNLLLVLDALDVARGRKS